MASPSRELEAEEAPDEKLQRADPPRSSFALDRQDELRGEGDGEDKGEEVRRAREKTLNLGDQPGSGDRRRRAYSTGGRGPILPAIASRARIRSPIGGWVSHSDFARSSKLLIGLTI